MSGVSLGAARILRFRNIADKQVVNDYLLPSGSLVYMTQEVQELWQHAIPPADTTEGRMSLTFRRMKVYPYKHSYSYRPEYNSDKMLIEFSDGDAENFFQDLLEVLTPMKLQVKDIQGLGMNDEFILNMDTEYGSFLYSKDVWGFAFIMAGENQACVERIAQLLAESDRFMREPWFKS